MIQKINPQINQVTIYRDLDLLESRDLMVQRWVNSKRIELSTTKEGRRIIESLYSLRAIDDLLNED